MGETRRTIDAANRVEEMLEVYHVGDEGNVLVGTLWQDEGGYRFAYARDFRERPDAKPVIPAFPDLGHTYESPVLWPFFRVRLAPPDREDVQEAITEAGLDPDDPAHGLRLVELLGGKSPVSPFEFRLRAARRGLVRGDDTLQDRVSGARPFLRRWRRRSNEALDPEPTE